MFNTGVLAGRNIAHDLCARMKSRKAGLTIKCNTTYNTRSILASTYKYEIFKQHNV